PVWPVEDRPVPQSKTPGEQTAPTQPFPTKPPAFDRQGVTIDDLIDFTPELRAAALEIVKQYVIGPMFTPPSIKGSGPNDTKGTIQLPGSLGGADWQGGACGPGGGRRRRRARGRVRSRDGAALRAIDPRSVRGRHHSWRSEANQSDLHARH